MRGQALKILVAVGLLMGGSATLLGYCRHVQKLGAPGVRIVAEPVHDMAEVARLAGVAKGTPYLYFRTKEELFVGLLELCLDGWFDELDAGLASGTGWMPAAGLADLVANSLAGHSLLRRLLMQLAPVLEHNLDADRALRFKWRVAGRLATTGSQLERRTVFLRPGDGPKLLLHLQALAMGIQGMAEPARGVRGVLNAPGLEVFRLDFARDSVRRRGHC